MKDKGPQAALRETRAKPIPFHQLLDQEPLYQQAVAELVEQAVARRLQEQAPSQEAQQLEALLSALDRRYGLSWHQEGQRDALLSALEGDSPYRSREHRRQQLQQQVALLQAKVPEFQLKVQLHDPLFCRLTRQGVPLFAAYALCSQQKTLQQAAEQAAYETRLALADQLRTGALRPAENGLLGCHSVRQEPDPRSMSARQREQLRQRVARGEKVYW